jgi:hypothetical protein
MKFLVLADTPVWSHAVLNQNPCAPPSVLRQEADTGTYWLGTHQDIVILIARPGSSQDAQHVQAAQRSLLALAQKLGRQVRFMFVVRAKGHRPPEGEVRGQISEAVNKASPSVSNAAMVVIGSGFSAAIHRSVLSAVYALTGPSAPFKVCSTVPEGAAVLLDDSDPARPAFVAEIEALLGPE